MFKNETDDPLPAYGFTMPSSEDARPQAPTLYTQRLILRPILKSDAEDIFEYCSCPENTAYMSWQTHKVLQDTFSFIDEMTQKYLNHQCCDLAFVLKDSGKVIGTGGAHNFARFPHLIEIGYIIHKDFWGQGYAVEALTAIIDFLFNTCNVHKIKGIHSLKNINSGKVMEKCGMIHEGTHKDANFINGVYHSTVHYGIVNPKHSKEFSGDPVERVVISGTPTIQEIREIVKKL